MKKELLKIIKCPCCNSNSFSIFKNKANKIEIREGHINCKCCKKQFSIKKGILDLLYNPSKEIINEQKGWVEADYNKRLLKEKKVKTLQQYLKELNSLHWKSHFNNFNYISNKLDLKGNENVLDLGAGRCWSTVEFAKKGCNCVALDILFEKFIGLETADIYFNKDKVYFERILGNMNKLPFKDETFDIVFSTASVHHSSNLNQLFKEISRVLAKNGKLVLVNEPVRGIFESSKLDCEEVKKGINEHNYRLIDYLIAARKNRLKPKIYLPANVVDMLETGEIEGNKKYKILLGKIVSLAWKYKLTRPFIKAMNYPGQIFIGMGLIMVTRKK